MFYFIYLRPHWIIDSAPGDSMTCLSVCTCLSAAVWAHNTSKIRRIPPSTGVHAYRQTLREVCVWDVRARCEAWCGSTCVWWWTWSRIDILKQRLSLSVQHSLFLPKGIEGFHLDGAQFLHPKRVPVLHVWSCDHDLLPFMQYITPVIPLT